MTGPYDPPSDPSPTHPLINQAFGWDTSTEVPPSVRQGISQSADTVANLRAALNQNVTNTWAQAAVNTDQLQGKIGYSIAGQLQGAANTLNALQQPIAMGVLGPLSTAVEMAMPLGITPPMPNTEQNVPLCVAIRQGALANDITPALEAYRAQAFPQRFTRGIQYVQVVNEINQCLGLGSPAQNAFANAVLQMESQPDTIQYSGAGVDQSYTLPAAAGTGFSQGAGPPPGVSPLAAAGAFDAAGNPVQPITITAPGGQGTTVTQGPGGPTITLTTPGGAQLGIGPPAAGPAMPAPPPGYVLPAPGGGTFYPGPATGTVPPGYIPGSGPPPIAPPGYSGGGASGAPPGISGSPSTGFIPGSGAPPTPPPPGPGLPPPVTTFPPGTVPPPGQIIGSGPPPGYTPPPTQTPYTPPGTTPPGPGPTPEKPPTTPPQPPPCIKLCPPDQPPPTPPKCKYDAYCSASSGIIYLVRTDQPPRGVSDTKLASGDPTEFNWQQIAEKCGGQPGPGNFVPPVQVNPVAVPDACGEFGAAPGANIPGGDTSLAAMLGLIGADGEPALPFPNAGPLDIAQNIVNAITQFSAKSLAQVASIIQGVLTGNPCYSPTMASLLGGDALTGFAERWVGVNLDTYRIQNAYNRHFLCPVLLPTIPEAASAWLANEIDEGTLSCWVRANNGRYNEIATAIRAGRTRLSPVQYGTLFMRDKITAADYNTRIRENGMIRPNDAQDVLDLLKQIPPPSDLVRMMVRDAADEALVAQFHLDDQFTDKFQGRVEEWSRQQGVDPDYMRFLWRSHWSIPSPGQLSEMLHRLSRLPPGDPSFVDLATIRQALVQQDIAPFWVDKFVSISYRPLTRIDARRAYENGALDDQGLIEAYLNLGYSQENAETLLEFNKRQRLLKFLRSPHIKQYATGELNGAQLDELLDTEGAPPDVIQSCHDQARVVMDSLRRSRCLKALRLRLLRGDLDPADTRQSLQSQGLDPDQIEFILAGWLCELDSRGKAIPAGELCTMFAQGALTVPDLVERLQRIGYSYDDAVLMARRCATTTQQKMTAAEQRQLKAQQAADQKQARAIARSAAQEARAIRQGQQLAEKAAATRVAREKRLIEAGEKFSKHFAGSLSDSILAVKAMYNQFASASLYTQDEIINALVVVTASPEVFDIPSLTVALQAALGSGPDLSSTALLGQSSQTTIVAPPPATQPLIR